MLKIHPFLWFDDEAEEAMRFYCSIFPNSKVNKVSVMPEANGEPGHIMTVECELDGLSVTALNAGPGDPFNTSMSLYVETKDQAETDHYWNALLAGGGVPKPCGWLVDKFGVYWQVAPRPMLKLFDDRDRTAAGRAFRAMLKMEKIELAEVERAFRGGVSREQSHARRKVHPLPPLCGPPSPAGGRGTPTASVVAIGDAAS